MEGGKKNGEKKAEEKEGEKEEGEGRGKRERTTTTTTTTAGLPQTATTTFGPLQTATTTSSPPQTAMATPTTINTPQIATITPGPPRAQMAHINHSTATTYSMDHLLTSSNSIGLHLPTTDSNSSLLASWAIYQHHHLHISPPFASYWPNSGL